MARAVAYQPKIIFLSNFKTKSVGLAASSTYSVSWVQHEKQNKKIEQNNLPSLVWNILDNCSTKNEKQLLSLQWNAKESLNEGKICWLSKV